MLPMKYLSIYLSVALSTALLSACSVTFESHASMLSGDDRAMAICGMGIIQTPDGPRPAISEAKLPAEAYKTYADCVQKLASRQQQPTAANTKAGL
jgi:hypothetical protein